MRRFAILGVLLASTTHAQETLTYCYDVHGRLVTVQRAGGPSSGVTTQHNHDPADNRSQLWIGPGTPPAPPAPRPPAFRVNDVAVQEGNALVFAISRHGSINTSYAVNYATAAGTAASGTDFTPTSGTLTFGPDDFMKTVSVQTTHDLTFEPDETVLLNLSGPTGGATLADAQGIGTILNNDSSNLSPLANDDVGPSAAICGEGVTVNVIANDTDPDGNYPLALDAIVSATRGYAGVQSSTNILFTPTGPAGLATIIYRVRDSLGATANGTLRLQVTGQGPCP